MKYLLFDANSLWSRAYYASQRAQADDTHMFQATSPSELGVKMVLNILDPYGAKIGAKFDGALFCWDGKAKSTKNRTEKPPDYEDTRAFFKQCLIDLFGCAHVTPQGEADDAVATAVYQFEKDHELWVVTGDKDLHQLYSEKTHIYCLNKSQVLSREQILARWAVKRPVQISLALAILGDPGDGIKGIRGYGPKKVASLFEHITPEMDLEAAYTKLLELIPDTKHAEFNESLEATLLQPEPKGVPNPLPLSWATDNVVRAIELQGIITQYARVRGVYTGDAQSEMAHVDLDGLFE